MSETRTVIDKCSVAEADAASGWQGWIGRPPRERLQALESLRLLRIPRFPMDLCPDFKKWWSL